MSRSRPVPTGAALATLGLLVCYLSVVPGQATIYLNQWAVEIDGGSGVADAVAADNGFRNLGQVRFIHRAAGGDVAAHLNRKRVRSKIAFLPAD